MILVVAISIIVIGYFIFSFKSLSPTGNQTQRLDTSDWKTYRNEDFGFEVKYPKTWVVGLELTNNITGKVDSISLMKPYQESDTEIYRRVAVQFSIQRNINPNRLSIQEWYANELQKIKGEPRNPPTSTVVATIGGKPAIFREGSLFQGSEIINEYLISINTVDVLNISYSRSLSQAQFDETYGEILSTFRFIH